MPDYKEMYLTLFRACEQAVNTLIAAQQACEDLYVNQSEAEEQTDSVSSPAAKE